MAYRIIDFADFMEILKRDIFTHAIKTWANRASAVSKDAEAFTQKTRDRLDRWSTELATGEPSAKEFESLIKGQRDLAEMVALKQIRLSLAEVDRCRNGIIGLLISTAFKVFV